MSKGSISAVRGVEHVGITVPDVEEATAFFVSAFGAVPLFDLVEPPVDDRTAAAEAKEWDLPGKLGVDPGTWTRHMRLLRLGDGANLELFQFVATEQRRSAIASDFGLQHLGISVDDIDAVADRVVAAGGTLLTGPNDLPGAESGPGNRYRYTRTPWGTTIELLATPAAQAYERGTEQRRWRPTNAGSEAGAELEHRLTVVVTLKIKNGSEERFLQAIRDHLPDNIRDPGFERLWVSRDSSDPSRFMLYEDWADQASFDASLRAAWRDSYLAATSDLWDADREITTWEPLPIGWERRAER